MTDVDALYTANPKVSLEGIYSQLRSMKAEGRIFSRSFHRVEWYFLHQDQAWRSSYLCSHRASLNEILLQPLASRI